MKTLPAVSIACASLLLCACRWDLGAPKQPVGQVAATVDGKEITVRQLQLELASAQFRDQQVQKVAEQGALNALIGRTALADAARKAGIDKTPDFEMQKSRMIDNLLAQAYAAKIAKDVPPPTREEAQRYVTDHAELFSDRKIYRVDQIHAIAPASEPNFPNQLAPIKTMPDMVALLNSKHIAFSRGEETIDSAAVDPRLAQALAKLPPQEVFVLINGPNLLINQIRSTQSAPISGDQAVALATQTLTTQHQEQAVTKAVQEALAAAVKSVQVNKAYQSGKPPSKPAAPSNN